MVVISSQMLFVEINHITVEARTFSSWQNFFFFFLNETFSPVLLLIFVNIWLGYHFVQTFIPYSCISHSVAHRMFSRHFPLFLLLRKKMWGQITQLYQSNSYHSACSCANNYIVFSSICFIRVCLIYHLDHRLVQVICFKWHNNDQNIFTWEKP